MQNAIVHITIGDKIRDHTEKMMMTNWVAVSVVCVSVNSCIYMACKSCVSVNHLHLHVQTFYTYAYILLPLIRLHSA